MHLIITIYMITNLAWRKNKKDEKKRMHWKAQFLRQTSYDSFQSWYVVGHLLSIQCFYCCIQKHFLLFLPKKSSERNILWEWCEIVGTPVQSIDSGRQQSVVQAIGGNSGYELLATIGGNYSSESWQRIWWRNFLSGPFNAILNNRLRKGGDTKETVLIW